MTDGALNLPSEEFPDHSRNPLFSVARFKTVCFQLRIGTNEVAVAAFS